MYNYYIFYTKGNKIMNINYLYILKNINHILIKIISITILTMLRYLIILLFNFIRVNGYLYNRNFKFIDLDHIKMIGNNWKDLWNVNENPISKTRKIECNQILNYAYRKDDYQSCLWENNYIDSYLLIIKIENEIIKIYAVLESPENIYYKNQINRLMSNLIILGNSNNMVIDTSPLKNWSHGLYLKV